MSTLADLYAKDPHQYSSQDLQTVVHVLREQYKAFKAGNTSAGAAPTRKLTEKQAAALETAGSDIDDLLDDL